MHICPVCASAAISGVFGLWLTKAYWLCKFHSWFKRKGKCGCDQHTEKEQ